MRFILKQANRVKIEEATLTKNTNNQTSQKQSKVAATTTD
jgi:predicted acetyltransferase